MGYSAEIQEMLAEWRRNLPPVIAGHDPEGDRLPSGRVVSTPGPVLMSDEDAAALLKRQQWTIAALAEKLGLSYSGTRGVLSRLEATGRARVVGRVLARGSGPQEKLWAA